MDLWSVQANNAGTSPLFLGKSLLEKPISLYAGKPRNFLEIRLSKLRVSSNSHSSSSGFRSLVVRASGKKDHGNSSFSGNDDHSNQEGDNQREISSSDSQNSVRISTDWREVRANLFAREQAEIVETNPETKTGTSHESKALGLKWAHPISVPEAGCVLVATEKLDGVRTFERTVVFLLRSGTRHPHEGPFGVVINRPMHKKIKHMKPTNLDLATTFSDCSVNFGGPLDANMFLLKSGGKSKLIGFEEVMPGLCFGARNSLDEAAELVKKGIIKPQDFRFFLGYAGWQLDQLREEIENEYWYVAACSSSLIHGGSVDLASEDLWDEILQLMGGRYSELSKKPKQDM